MKKLFLGLFLVLASVVGTNAQTFTETFDANSLGWTESAGESSSGTVVIDNGVMTIKSKGDSKLTRLAANFNGAAKGMENTAFETHCYAPLDIKKPFEIVANVKVDDLALERQAGFIFNYRDFGNYYAFVFNKESVSFLRFVDNRCVGSITQDVKWQKGVKGKKEQIWKLISDGGQLQFFVNDMEIMKVKYMPLDFTGVGFYTIGKQTLVVDDVTFTQR